jgi:ethanolaminephosphotransferase
LVTLIGFFAMVFHYALILYYVPNFEGEAPSWVYFVLFLCIYFYQTMDALDGKQARRTGTSSPAGEIFDHGCDALSLSFMSLTVCTVVQIGPTFTIPFAMSFALLSFFTTQWEEYHTQILYLGYVNVTEAQVFIMVIHLTAYSIGPLWFAQTVTVFGHIITYGELCIVISIVGSLTTSILNILKVINLYRSDFNKLLSAFSQFLPFFQIIFCLVGWTRMSPDIYEKYSHFILIGCGTLVAAIVGFLVVFRVAKQPFPLFYPFLLPTFVPFLLHLFSPSAQLKTIEEYFAVFFGIYGMLVYLYYAQKILREIANVFQIKLFTIPSDGYDFNKKK